MASYATLVSLPDMGVGLVGTLQASEARLIVNPASKASLFSSKPVFFAHV